MRSSAWKRLIGFLQKKLGILGYKDFELTPEQRERHVGVLQQLYGESSAPAKTELDKKTQEANVDGSSPVKKP